MKHVVFTLLLTLGLLFNLSFAVYSVEDQGSGAGVA